MSSGDIDRGRRPGRDLRAAVPARSGGGRGPAPIFVADDQGRYAAVNVRVCETLGYTCSELLDMCVTDVAVSPEAPELYEAMLRRRTAGGLTTIRCKDGRLLPFRYEASQVRVAQMEFWVSIGVIELPASGPSALRRGSRRSPTGPKTRFAQLGQ